MPARVSSTYGRIQTHEQDWNIIDSHIIVLSSYFFISNPSIFFFFFLYNPPTFKMFYSTASTFLFFFIFDSPSTGCKTNLKKNCGSTIHHVNMNLCFDQSLYFTIGYKFYFKQFESVIHYQYNI